MCVEWVHFSVDFHVFVQIANVDDGQTVRVSLGGSARALQEARILIEEVVDERLPRSGEFELSMRRKPPGATPDEPVITYHFCI